MLNDLDTGPMVTTCAAVIRMWWLALTGWSQLMCIMLLSDNDYHSIITVIIFHNYHMHSAQFTASMKTIFINTTINHPDDRDQARKLV